MNLSAKVTQFKLPGYNILFIVCQSCFCGKNEWKESFIRCKICIMKYFYHSKNDFLKSSILFHFTFATGRRNQIRTVIMKTEFYVLTQLLNKEWKT